MVYCSGLENPTAKSSEMAEMAEFCGLQDAPDALFTARSAGRDGTWVGTGGTATFNVKDMRRPKVSVIYFVRAATGAIKIGTTGYLESRIKMLSRQSPVAIELVATCPGNRAVENIYHARFAEHRLHGEWFNPHPDILAEIERLSPTGEE